MRSIRAIENVDVVALVIDATRGIEAQDMNLFSLAQKNGKGIVIIINKWDLFEKDTNTAKEYEAFVKEKGLFSFFKDGHKECCGIRKVEPLKRKLATLDAWISGQRKDQSPSTRSSVPVVEIDHGNSNDQRKLIKFNPLANWTSKEVWDYIRLSEVPFNPLHEKGFISIGCDGLLTSKTTQAISVLVPGDLVVTRRSR